MIKRTATVLTALLLLTGCGGGGEPAAQAQPEPEVSVLVSPGPERVVEVPGPEREVTPEACLRALDLADEGFSNAGEVMGEVPALIEMIGEGVEAGAMGDVAAVEDMTGRLSTINDTLSEQADAVEGLVGPYTEAKEECRAAAE